MLFFQLMTRRYVTNRGNSYRMRQGTELWQTLHVNHDAEPGPNRRRRARQEVADDLRLVPSSTCQVINRRNCRTLSRR